MRSRRSAVLRFFFIAFQLIKHLGGYLLFSVLKRLRLVRPSRRRGIWSNISRPERIRLFLQSVDGALIKIGQILSMRVDYLPEEYIQELLKLLDEVPPFDPLKAKRIIEEELQGKLDELFETFDGEPLAAASFGQVHAATLPGGEEVVVKIRRPGVVPTIEADLKLFRIIAFVVDTLGITRRVPLREIYNEFAEWTREELDYKIEGSHIQEIYDKAKGSQTERIPKVHWPYTTARVLTLERLRGLWVKEVMQGLHTDRAATLEKLSSFNTDLTKVSQNLLHNAMRQIFIYGIYHADPHGANILIMDDGVIGYVDFGITGRIGETAKETQVNLHIALESGDFEKFYLAIMETIQPPHGADLSSFRSAVRQGYINWLNAQYMGHSNTRERSFARLMLRLNNAAQKYGLAFRSAEVRIFRTLVTVDAVLLNFAPTLDVRAEFRAFFRAYRAVNIVTTRIPALLHKLPNYLDMLNECLERTALIHTARVSNFRKGLGVLFQLLGLALFVLGVVALFVPGRARLLLLSLGLRPVTTAVLLILVIIFCAWLGYILKLRSVIYYTIMEHGRNPLCRPKEK